jgi:hypothetical protein
VPKIQNVSPLGDLEVPALRRSVAAGEVVDVPAEVAGRAPSWGPADESTPDFLTRVVVDEDGLEVLEAFDPGFGLLAQPENFIPAPASKKRSTPAADSADAAAGSAPADPLEV